MEEVIGKMQTGHKAMVRNMIDDFKQCSPPPKVLQPLQAVLDDASMRGHEFFNVRALLIASAIVTSVACAYPCAF